MPRKAAKSKKQLSIRGLALALGKSHVTVRKWIKHTGWSYGGPPWSEADVPAIANWAKANLRENPAEAGKYTEPKHARRERRAKLRVLIERAAKLQLDREVRLGVYIKKADVEAAQVQRVQLVRRELQNIRLLALKLEGMTLPQREQLLENWARDVCRKFADGDD